MIIVLLAVLLAITPLPDSLTQIVQRFQQQTEPKRCYELLIGYAK